MRINTGPAPMLRTLSIFVCATMAMAQVANDATDLRRAYDAHRWFDLSVDSGLERSPFFAGATAIAFNDLSRARRHFQPLLHPDSRDEHAEEAHHQLINAYLRQGLYSHAKAVLAMGASRFESLRSIQPLVYALAESGDLAVTRRAASKLPREAQREGLYASLTINGHPASYVVDTGANFCVLTRSEAQRHGMRIVDVGANVTSSSGQAVGFRIAVAEELTLGECRLQNVAFLVFGDEQQPFNEMPAHSRGAVGLPVLLALRTLSWTRETIEFGANSMPRSAGHAAMCFDGLYPIVQAKTAGRAITLVLDTGARRTHLWKPLFDAVPHLSIIAENQPATTTHGVGGSARVENVRLSALPITFGDPSLTLKPAEVHLTPTTAQSHFYHGNLGRDLLQQASRVRIDFVTLQLALE